MRIKIFYKVWEFLFVPRGLLAGNSKKAASRAKSTSSVSATQIKEEAYEEDGDCDPPDAKGKKIRVANDLPPRRELEITIHECLHACDWYKDEEWVQQAADDISRLLWKLGWRKNSK